MLEQAVRARLDPDGHQVIEVVVDGGYHPGAIVARAGVPLRLVFHRRDDDACSERVVFSTPRLDRRLAPSGTTTIDLPPRPPGEIRFTCGMGRYRGRIDLVADRAPSVIARLRAQASHLESPVGTALVLWICSLPVIALVALFFLDATAALLVAIAALVGWVAGCVWAFRRTAAST